MLGFHQALEDRQGRYWMLTRMAGHILDANGVEVKIFDADR